ncbi:MAG: hypothetical protein WDW38_009205 [Sanguina aurantia]
MRLISPIAHLPSYTAAPFSPPTVSDTKAKFMEGYRKPIASIYSTVMNELIVQQHFIRYSVNYVYNPVFAMGFVSVFEQIMESVPSAERTKVFDAYIMALGEDPAVYRADAAMIEAQASSLSGPEGLAPSADGNDLQKALAAAAAGSASGKFAYNKFFAIGLFRLLELTGAKEPAALEKLVKSVGVKQESVMRDLVLYKGILSKLSSAKDLMKEFIEREKRKNTERLDAKAAKAASAAAAAAVSA